MSSYVDVEETRNPGRGAVVYRASDSHVLSLKLPKLDSLLGPLTPLLPLSIPQSSTLHWKLSYFGQNANKSIVSRPRESFNRR